MAHTVASRPVPGGETWARSALAALTSVPGVHRAGLALTEGGGRRLLFTANDRDNDNFVQWCEIDPGDDVPLNHTARTGKPVNGSREGLAGRFPAYVDRQTSHTQAIATQPIVAAGQVLGGYVLYFDTPQPFDAAQHRHLAELGARLGQQLRHVQRTTRHTNRSLVSEATPDGALVATYRVSPDVRSVAGARHWAQTRLAGWGVNGSLADNAVLCLNELVTNAVLHTDAGCEVRLMLEQGADRHGPRRGFGRGRRPQPCHHGPLGRSRSGAAAGGRLRHQVGFRTGCGWDDGVVHPRACHCLRGSLNGGAESSTGSSPCQTRPRPGTATRPAEPLISPGRPLSDTHEGPPCTAESTSTERVAKPTAQV